MKPAATIYRDRGRMIKNRAGTWTLAFTIAYQPGHSGYVQLRGERNGLIEHARTIGIRWLYLPGCFGLVPIEYAVAMLDDVKYGDSYTQGVAAEDSLTEEGE